MRNKNGNVNYYFGVEFNLTEGFVKQRGLKWQQKLSVKLPGGEGTPYNGLYGEAPPERGTFFRLQV